MFDQPSQDGIGEALLKRHNGPIAYWGATGVCLNSASSLSKIGMAVVSG